MFTSQGTNLNLKLQFEELSKQAWVYKDKLKDINQAFGKNMKLITQYEVNLILEEEGIFKSNVTTIDEKIMIVINLDQTYQYKTFKVVSIHNGEIMILDTIYDQTNHTVSFEADAFSTFMLFTNQAKKGFNWWWLMLLLIIPTTYVLYHTYDGLEEEHPVKVKLRKINNSRKSHKN